MNSFLLYNFDFFVLGINLVDGIRIMIEERRSLLCGLLFSVLIIIRARAREKKTLGSNNPSQCRREI
jgi:hypothetical protein